MSAFGGTSRSVHDRAKVTTLLIVISKIMKMMMIVISRPCVVLKMFSVA